MYVNNNNNDKPRILKIIIIKSETGRKFLNTLDIDYRVNVWFSQMKRCVNKCKYTFVMPTQCNLEEKKKFYLI